MRIVIDEARLAAPGMWLANVDPAHLFKLANSPAQAGLRHIVLVSGARFNKESQQLEFDLNSATVLNLGKGNEGIFVDAGFGSMPGPAQVTKASIPSSREGGDALFRQQLMELPADMRSVGESLLESVRANFSGELRFHPKSKKFVETPDNFWVVRIQPRDESLRIVIYGRPESHANYSLLNLTADMGSYSTFKLDKRGQLLQAVEAIKAAKALKTNRH